MTNIDSINNFTELMADELEEYNEENNEESILKLNTKYYINDTNNILSFVFTFSLVDYEDYKLTISINIDLENKKLLDFNTALDICNISKDDIKNKLSDTKVIDLSNYNETPDELVKRIYDTADILLNKTGEISEDDIFNICWFSIEDNNLVLYLNYYYKELNKLESKKIIFN